ncbi:Aste57867_8721 [Aphanomyces stellatus]|uniref:Aste57867_8721 protein n=1 Tax=Aphanomyces stellatus TaxID=120398 RepID=A0A485KL33_9STRA|nr:hypothetical protein As57867_008687 [Aphanomyces stellatus]VFT85607.1 Aste57867_8721 [Aphanomyces stellatus]
MTIRGVDYDSFSKGELLQIIRRFKKDHESSSDSIDDIARSIHTLSSDEPAKKKPKHDGKKPQKPFDFSRYRTRHVALKFSYMGEKYAGFARQDHMEHTIERYLIDALKTARLVEDFNTCGYSRCGRTDAGVSALGQVVGLQLRSNVPVDATLLDDLTIDDIQPNQSFRVQLADGTIKTLQELDYPVCLNSALPQDIRVYAWTSAPPEWSARFLCTSRTYRYFFHRRTLDLDAMSTAARLLEGKHDYRNFCRMDPSVTNFEREILSFNVHVATDLAGASEDPYYQLCYFEIRGRAFLWHQVRCMAAILFLVGKGHEPPALVSTLLDIEGTPRKPQYEMAPDLPLVLHDCTFDTIDIWYAVLLPMSSMNGLHDSYMPGVLNRVYHDIEGQWEAASLRMALLRNHLDRLKHLPVHPKAAIPDMKRRQTPQTPAYMAAIEAYGDANEPFGSILHMLPAAGKGLKHIPLLQRKCGFSFEEKMVRVKRKADAKKERENDEGDEHDDAKP